MMYSDLEPIRGTAWLRLTEGAQISYRLDPGDDWARFVFLGPVEVELDMPRSIMQRCRDLFDAALTEIDASQPADTPRTP